MKSSMLAMLTLLTGCLANFSVTELHLLFSLHEFFDARFLVFVEGEINSADAADEVRRTSEFNIPSIIVTSEQLRIAFERDEEFPWRTIITTKRAITLGPLLKLVRNTGRLVWALFSEPSDMDSVVNNIPYTGNVFLIQAETDSLRIYELLHSRNSQKALTRSFGFIETDSKTTHFPHREHFRHLKSNLSGVDIRIGYPEEPCERRKDGVLLERIFCSHSKILEILAETLSFTQIDIVHRGGNYSFVNSNGSYSGFFKMLVDEEADLSIAGFVVTGRRMNDFNFIWPTFGLETVMYVRKSDIGRYSSCSPFPTRIWVITIIWIFVMGVFLSVSNRYDKESETKKRNNLRSIFTDVFEILQLTCCQGSADIPSFTVSRIIYSTMLFGGLLLYYYYSSTVQSNLTVEGFSVPFNNFDGFLKNGKFTIIGLADGFSIYFIKFEISNLNVTNSKLILEQDDLPTNVEDGIRILCDEEFLTLLELKGSVLNVDKTNCELIEIPSPILFQYFGFAAVKGFQYGEYFTRMLWRLNELGIIERMRNNLTKVSNIKALNEGSGYQPVTFEQIFNLLIILKTGILSSLFVLILEMRKSGGETKFSRRHIHKIRLHKTHLRM